MSYHLFLDDERIPQKVNWVVLPQASWVIARNYDEFVKTIKNRGMPSFISFDHDLFNVHYEEYHRAVEQKRILLEYEPFHPPTGYHCAVWLRDWVLKNNFKIPPFEVHSLNHMGAANIKRILYENSFLLLDKKPNFADSIFMNDTTALPDYVKHDETTVSGFFGPYRFLSNFWPAQVEFMGLNFPSVEAAYQAAKTLNPKEQAQFVYVNPREAKKLGRTVAIRPDWETIKDQIMFYAVLQKFSKHPELRKNLLQTGTRSLVEANNWKDNYWGITFEFDDVNNVWIDKGGRNNLGRILEHVRTIVKINE